MSRRPQHLPNTTLRLSDEDAAAADERARSEGFMWGTNPNRSEWVRFAIKYALIHMPHGWRPE